MAGSSKSAAAFPAWALLNGIKVHDLSLKDIPDKGFGFVAEKKVDGSAGLGSHSEYGETFIRVPRELVLSAEAVSEYTKVDQHFHQLLETTSPLSTRAKVVLYLFVHLVAKSNQVSAAAPTTGIVSTPWTEYMKLLPRDIPIPTLWSDDERCLLQGTSLELAIEAKMTALQSEFDKLREDTMALPFWNARWWEKDTATLGDWILADAWYRSRCLELPQAGEAMVPGLDMVNHSNEPTAIYQELNDGDVTLQLRPEQFLSEGQEITISYGQTKSAAEMLFSYGFIDTDTAVRELTLHLDAMSDDPLGRAKIHAYGKPPTATFSLKEGTAHWESPFILLMCLNEEDGLAFRVLQDQDGDRHLRVFWQDQDVTERVGDFNELVEGHPLQHVFALRTVALLEEMVESQLERIRLPLPCRDNQTDDPARPGSAHGRVETASILHTIETEVLEAVAMALGREKATLLQDDQVLGYLGRMEDSPNEQAASASTNEEPDFS